MTLKTAHVYGEHAWANPCSYFPEASRSTGYRLNVIYKNQK